MEGNKLLSCKYEWVEYYKGYISASEDGLKYGVLDLQGKVLVPFEYSQYFNLDKERGIFVMRSANSFSIKNEI